MKNIFLVVVCLFISISIFAQSTVIGKVIDAKTKQPIEFANVVLINKNDSSKILGTKTKADGTYEIKNVPYFIYVCKISAVGYVTKNFGVKVSIAITDSKVSLLEVNSKTINEVTITAEKNDIKLEIDKKVFNVEKNTTSAGGTAIDVLKNVPSVNVDMDGSVSVRGKENVTIYIDGKPSALMNSDPQTALSSIPASSIENIEVITNPSSKYEAQGMNGIINIVLKKDRKPGYNGMFTLGLGTPYKLNAGINANANIKKWNFFANANFRNSKNWEETTSKRDNFGNDLTYYSFTHNDRKPLNGFINLGAEYAFNAKNKISISQNVFNAKMKGDSKTTIENGHQFTNIFSRQQRNNTYTGNPLNATTNIQYKHVFKDPKEEITFEGNFSKARYRRESVFNTTQYDSSNAISNHYIQNQPVLGGNWNITLQADYTKPLGKNAKIEIGEKSYFIKFKSENQPTITYDNQQPIAETILKNHFVFNQQLHAAYVNVANQFQKTGVQLGFRGEYFAYEGTIYQYNASAKNGYFNLFPTAFFTHKINNKEDISFNYARRVNRPNFRQLIPYIDVSNPQDTSMGNPNLKPEFIHATEVSYAKQYQKNATFIASVYYQYTANLMQRYRRYNSDGTTFSQNRNLAHGTTYGIELTNKFNILSWWDATINLNGFRNIISGNNIDTTLNAKGFGGFGKITTNAKLKHGYSVQLTGNYNAKTVIAQGFVEPYSTVDIAIKKSLYKNLLTLTFNATDVFNTLQTNTIYNYYPVYNQHVLRKNLTRTFGINLQMKFANKSQLKNTNASSMPSFNKKGSKKDKEGKNRDENLKKDEEGGGEENNSQTK